MFTTRILFVAVVSVTLSGLRLLAHQPHDPMTAVAVSPNYSQDQTVLAATNYLTAPMGVFALLKSSDGGATFSVVPSLANNSEILTLAFSPGYAADQTIYAAGLGGVFRTTNQANSWSTLTKNAALGLTLSPNFNSDNTLFLLTTSRKIFISNDRGNTWKLLTTPASLTSGLSTIAVSPNYAADTTLLLGSNQDGILRSNDGGITWASVTSGLTLPKVAALAYSPNFSSDHTVLAVTGGSGVLVSTDGGNSWTSANSGITDLNVSSAAWSADGSVWITTAVAGVFRSNNAGASWVQCASIPRQLSQITTAHYTAIAPFGSGSSLLLYLATYEGLWMSSDGASSWQYRDTLPTKLIRHLKLSPNYARDQTVFAATYGGGNLWSTTGGQSWTFQNTGMLSAYTDAAGISPNFATDGTAFIGMANGLQATTNFGATWSEMAALNTQTYPRGLDVSPNFAQDHTVFIGTANGDGYPLTAPYQGGQVPNQGLFLSLDGGNDWIPTTLGGPPITAIAISPSFASDHTAFAGSPNSGLFKSTDGGLTWVPVYLPTPSLEIAKVALSPTYHTDHAVLVGFIDGGVYKSGDGGTTWTLIPKTAGLRALDIAFSPNWAADRTFFLATAQLGVFKFTNSGKTAQNLLAPDTFVTALGVSPNFAKDETMYAACYTGLYKSTDGGTTWAYTAEPARVEESRNVSSSNEQPPTIVYQGSWTEISSATTASTNAYMTTTGYGDTAVFNFVGSRVRWVGWTGPSQGSASILLDGVPQGIVSLKAPSDQFQQTVWEQDGIPCAAHTLTITAQPQAGQTVTIDAFDVWQDACSFTAARRVADAE